MTHSLKGVLKLLSSNKVVRAINLCCSSRKFSEPGVRAQTSLNKRVIPTETVVVHKTSSQASRRTSSYPGTLLNNMKTENIRFSLNFIIK